MPEYQTKFSGVKAVEQTGATRDTRENKGRYDLISSFALKRLAGVYERGAVNHGDNNWMKGIPYNRLIDSSLRHIHQYKMGYRDEDHIAQAVWNLCALLHFDELGLSDELNDLPNYKLN